MKKQAYFLVLTVLLMSASAFAKGNKNDLAYLGYDELQTVDGLTTSDEVIVVENSIPKKGTSISSILALDIYAKSEIGVTSDTLAASESGTIYVCTSNCTKSLPAVADNLEYTFVAGSGITVTIDPNSTDQIMYLNLDGGDKIASTGATADSVTLLGDKTNSKWYVVNMKGTWTDAGA